jgi:hypothetical protein
VLRVARTLADLDGADTVGRVHLAEDLLPDPDRRGAPRGGGVRSGASPRCRRLTLTRFYATFIAVDTTCRLRPSLG